MEPTGDTSLLRSRTRQEHFRHIRPLRREDRAQIQRLLIDTDVFTQEEIAIALELVDSVLDRPEQHDYMIASYDEEGEVLGYYCIGPTPATKGTFDLYWIAVRPGVHGTGVGGALEEHAEALIRSMGGRLIIAETSSQPRYAATRTFYLHHGYRELSRIQSYYREGDDLVVYGKYCTS